MATTAYTDGACLQNPDGPGGWAWAVPDGAHASGADPKTTNQRMELMAALSAVRALDGPLTVVSDSLYVVNCFNKRWYVAWERKGWTNSARQPVANQDLWRPLVELFHARKGKLSFQWVKGHSGDVMNDLVDRLAVEAARTQNGRSGPGPPSMLGPPDKPTRKRATSTTNRSTAAGPVAPAGHRIVVFGHRPPQLGGYDDDNPIAAQVSRKLTEILAGLRAVHPDAVVLSGLGLGAEQLGAQAAARAKMPYVPVLAFPNPDEVWPEIRRASFRHLVETAKDALTFSADKPTSTQSAARVIARRNDWLVDQADCALVVWDGKDRALGTRVRALEKRLPDDVWIIPPESD
ncbi:MAG: ribonuclease H family protein [Actinopolymorphaceae bacterium]